MSKYSEKELMWAYDTITEFIWKHGQERDENLDEALDIIYKQMFFGGEK